MAKTIEQYMSKTRADYGSGVARPKIEDKDKFELKGQFLKELRTNTFSGSDHEDANEHIEKLRNEPIGSITTWDDLKTKFLNKYCPPARTAKKMEEINNFQQEPDENLYQAWERFKELLMKCPQHYLTEIQEIILFYNGLGIPTRQILDSRGAIPSKTVADAKIAIQEMAEYSQKWHNGTSRLRSTETSDGLAAIQAQLNNLLSLRVRMELDLEARLIRETLVLNRSLDPFFEDYIELNDLNKPFELRRNQGDDLTIEEGKVIEEFRTRDDELDIGIDDYPSYCDYDKKIHIDYTHNLKFSCMIGFEFTHTNFFPLLYVNVMSKKFLNSIMKEKMVYKGNNVIVALMNVPIFVGTFSVVMDFAVIENIDAYRDEGMGDVILGEPILREVGIKTKRFERIITICNGDDEVTYQMVRSHPRFKRHTNEQCNKIPPLLKVSEKYKMNGISHAYQKLKGFYKRVLNLGPDYIRDAKTEEWLTYGHISVHEME
ncbi:homeodomain-like protein [Tanacetum coccineum]